jgi:hypothetical protein
MTPRPLVAVLFLACNPRYTAAEFEQDLFDLQCQLDTCHQADDSCTGTYIQPRASDCDFDPELGQACLDAVQALIDSTPEMWLSDGDTTWCDCGDPSTHTYDWEGEVCLAMPDPFELPPACDVVCTDLQ